MPPKQARKRAAAGPASASSSNQAEAGPFTRPGPTAKRIKMEPSSLPNTFTNSADEAGAETQLQEQATDQNAPLISSLTLGGVNLRPPIYHGQAIVSEVLLFPSRFAFLKSKTDALFSVNCTPHVRYEMPLRIAQNIYSTRCAGPPLLSNEIPPYIHLGRTNALEVPLHFYAMLSGTPTRLAHHHGKHWPADAYEEWFDETVIPALTRSGIAKYGIKWSTWDSYNDAISCDFDGNAIATEENLPAASLHHFWHHLRGADHGRHLENAVLFAYGDLHGIGRLPWKPFADAWAEHVAPEHLKEGSIVTPGVQLSVGP